jgi:hypothetical protein
MHGHQSRATGKTSSASYGGGGTAGPMLAHASRSYIYICVLHVYVVVGSFVNYFVFCLCSRMLLRSLCLFDLWMNNSGQFS